MEQEATSFRALCKELGLPSKNQERFVSLARDLAIQRGRASGPVSRTTALIASASLSQSVMVALLKLGVDWSQFLQQCGLEHEPFAPKDRRENIFIDSRLERAIRGFISPPDGIAQARKARIATTVGYAILQDVANSPDDGLIGGRLIAAGLDLELLRDQAPLYQSMMGLEGRKFPDDFPLRVAWVCQYDPRGESESILRERKATDDVYWYWGNRRGIKTIRPGDPVIYLRQIDRSKHGNRGGIVGTGIVLSNRPEKRRFAAEVIRRLEGVEKPQGTDLIQDGLRTMILQLFVDQMIPRDEVFEPSLFPTTMWRGSVVQLNAEQSNHVHQELKNRGLWGLEVWAPPDGLGAPATKVAQEMEVEGSTEQITNSHLMDDAPEHELDRLDRGPLAIMVGRFLHQLWVRRNRVRPDAGAEDAFVFHLDAPWGGGKTTFANFVAEVLRPIGINRRTSFLALEMSSGSSNTNTVPVFLGPAEDQQKELEKLKPDEMRRPWLVVRFNAWRHEHVNPPWWHFYQVIRRQCFQQLWREGLSTFGTDGQPPRVERGRLCRAVDRWWRMCLVTRLVIEEWCWSLTSRRVLMPLISAVLTAGLLGAYVVFQSESFWTQWVLPALAGLGAVWTFSSTVTGIVAPESKISERLLLGGGDPIARFKRHFVRLCEKLGRPVLVIVDDLDRCQPHAVVGLMKGMQNILSSPRVVYLVLGDRNWIRCAFEHENKPMAKLEVGDQHSLGGRFTEKVIQMSLLLPAASDEARMEYVKWLLGAEGVRTRSDGTKRLEDTEDETVADSALMRWLLRLAPPAYRRWLKRRSFNTGNELERIEESTDGDVMESTDHWTEAELAEASDEWQMLDEMEARVAETIRGIDADQIADISVAESNVLEALKRQDQAWVDALSELHLDRLRDIIGAAIVRKAGHTEATQAEVAHRLEALVGALPSNPRQVKRIINTITIYQQLAVLRRDLTEEGPEAENVIRRWRQLALWIILMLEWPGTWRMLCRSPELLDAIHNETEAVPTKRDEDNGQAAEGGTRTASEDAQVVEVRRNTRLMKVLVVSSKENGEIVRLDEQAVRWLRKLTPIAFRATSEGEVSVSPEPPQGPEGSTRS